MADDHAAGRPWRILVAAPFPPRLDGRHGGSRALAEFLARLTKENRVALLVLRSDDESSVDETLAGKCDFVEEVCIPAVGPSFAARLRNWLRLRVSLLRGTPTWAAQRSTADFADRLHKLARTWQPDVVQLEYRIMGQFLPAIRGTAPSVLVDHDPDSPEGTQSALLASFESRAWNSLGRSVSSQVDTLVAFTDRDRRTLSVVAGSTPVVRIPISYDLPAVPLDPAGKDSSGIVWIGSFIHPPNIDAAVRLATRIFPPVRARVPSATLRLIGSHASGHVQHLDGGGVSVAADVPDVRPYLDSAALFAAPIRQGGGMRVKILEALAYGKAIVASPLALEGLDVKDGEHVVVAETDAEFENAIVELLNDPARRKAIATAARRWAEAHLDSETQVRAYEALYTSIVSGRNHQTWPASAVRR
jgi:glycosyltransferase involved in cell wall biosynthesis